MKAIEPGTRCLFIDNLTVNEDFYRPKDGVNLLGDPTIVRAKLGWNPNKTSFEQLVKLLVEQDIAKVASEGAAAKVRTNLAEYFMPNGKKLMLSDWLS